MIYLIQMVTSVWGKITRRELLRRMAIGGIGASLYGLSNFSAFGQKKIDTTTFGYDKCARQKSGAINNEGGNTTVRECVVGFSKCYLQSENTLPDGRVSALNFRVSQIIQELKL